MNEEKEIKTMKNLPKFISVHVPKTAGTTFLKLLSSTYGRSLKSDYLDIMNLNSVILHGDEPKNKMNPNIGKYKVIMGHFRASKYLHLKHPYVAWVRDPVDRAISHYYFWKKLWKKERKRNWDPKLSELFEKGWSVIDFSKMFSDQMSYFLDCNIKHFKFIGISENFDQELSRFEKIFGIKVKHIKKKFNVNARKEKVNKKIRKEIEKYHKKDFELYRKAVEISNS